MRLPVAAVAVLLPALAGAQSEVIWSAFAGATSGTLAQPGASYESRLGSTAGLAWTMQLNPYVAFEVAGAFMQKGGRLIQPTANTADIRLDYFEMPLSVRFSDAMVGDGQRAFVRLGLSLGTEFKCTSHGIYVDPRIGYTNYDYIVTPFTPSVCDQLRDKVTDYGPLAGLGVVIRRGLGQLTMEVRRTEGRRLDPQRSAVHLRPSTTSLLIGMGVSTP